ncbi:kinase [Paramuricea clavata]|uniref:Kinase n=1 Tax=Paramuricea clavata TaxID=317549 RepID=A0A6S7GV79_PARCT|nr:kinase [Paramuricea clavata]
MVKDYLNELKIHCIYIDRGCHEIVQLEHLDNHEATCGFTPAVCANQGCGVTLNQHDLIHHQSELCEFRKLKCHSCGETTKTLANMEKRIVNVEKNIAILATNETMKTKIANVEKNLEKNMERNAADMEGKLEAVNNEVRGLKTALIKGFDEMKDVLVKMEDKIEENTRKVRNTASGDKENIIVAGGAWNDSVEIFNWRQRTWSPLQSLPKQRSSATSFVYNNHVTIAGGHCSGFVDDDITRMNINPKPDLSVHWSNCPVKLLAKLACHSSVLYNDHLIVTGGRNGNGVSDCIHEVQLVSSYAVKILSRMPEPRQYHSTQLFDDNLFIVGGSTTDRSQDSLSSVVVYDIKKNECKELAPLPYEVSKMATVRWGDNIVVIGGADKRGKALDTVIIYNVKTEQSHLLPSMRCKRRGCTAVVIGNNIVVLGGQGEQGTLKSVEAFNFESYTWQGLPEMSRTLSRIPQPRQFHSTQRFDDNLLIVDGRTTDSYQDNLSSVVLYDIKKNECKQLASLPYEVSVMATVRWGDNIDVIGGADKHGKALGTVFIYNVKTEQSHLLPSMRCIRRACAAVVIGNNIIVLGGIGEQDRSLKSVETFDFERYILGKNFRKCLQEDGFTLLLCERCNNVELICLK